MKKYLIGIVIGIVITAMPIGFLMSDVVDYAMFYGFVVSKYDGEIDDNQMKESIYDGILNGLGDEHSQYISSKYLDNFNESLATTYEGIGVMIQVQEVEPFVTVTKVFDGGAASEENIRVGDQILKVNGEPMTAENAEEVSTMIKSEPKVELETYRPSTKENIKINTTGKSYSSPSVHSSVITQGEQKNGFIKIDSFSETTGEEFASALDQIEAKDIDKLVIDLRDNPGGELGQLEKIANEIVPGDRPYLITKNDDKVSKEYTSKLKEPKEYPIIILQNENTASAAEILSAALKELNNSEVYGTTSYGKGSVQQVFEVPNTNAAMKVTIEHWYSPDENKIDGIGVEPTVEMEDNHIYVAPIILKENLEYGQNGNQVIQLKNYLKLLGYNIDVDNNNYDFETQEAVKSIQYKSGLPVTGIVDLDTADAIYDQADAVKYHPDNDQMVKKTFN